MAGGVRELAPDYAEFLFQIGDLSGEFRDFTVALRLTLVVAFGHVRHLPIKRTTTRNPTYPWTIPNLRSAVSVEGLTF
ncbi:hypothetical protein GCM10009799_15670 [Nocardiopsis rhodophaea]|uniref:Uncharacterized protein n=1 Tax=Nocardiopsis rhodophaea TaxID=280238 RepID=A0ABN2SS58_9ACTN